MDFQVHRFLTDALLKVGTDANHAKQLADVLVAGDLRGHYSHGLNRIGMILYFDSF